MKLTQDHVEMLLAMRYFVGCDVDTCEPQLVHLVRETPDWKERATALMNDNLIPKVPMCGADTLWGYGVPDVSSTVWGEITCPECIEEFHSIEVDYWERTFSGGK